jgi:hypothetical protein
MIKLILFIVYRACHGKDFYLKSNPWQLESARFYIIVFFVMHFFQLLLLTRLVRFRNIGQMNGTGFIAFFVIGIGLYWLSTILLPERSFKEAMATYEESDWNSYAKLICWSYLFLNLFLIGVIGVIMLP